MIQTKWRDISIESVTFARLKPRITVIGAVRLVVVGGNGQCRAPWSSGERFALLVDTFAADEIEDVPSSLLGVLPVWTKMDCLGF